jgi:hypothetical protein
MSRFAWLAVACVCGLALTAGLARADDNPVKKADPAETILAALDREIDLGDKNISETPLGELLSFLAKKYNLTFVVMEEYFAAEGTPNIRENKPRFGATQLRGMTMHQFLNTTLESMGATYLIRNGAVEVVPTKHAAKVTKSAASQDEDGRTRLDAPLVSVVARAQPLDEVLAAVADRYDLNVVLTPQGGEARTAMVTARMLNLPADKALELLALQADLRLVRKGTAFLVTSKDHAAELHNEKTDRERERIELQKLREAPAKPVQPAK